MGSIAAFVSQVQDGVGGVVEDFHVWEKTSGSNLVILLKGEDKSEGRFGGGIISFSTSTDSFSDEKQKQLEQRVA